MSPELTVRPGESNEVTIPTTLGWERKNAIGQMRRLKIDVDRRDLDGVTLNKKRDRIRFNGVDNDHLLVDILKGGESWTLKCYSREWAANRTKPTSSGSLFEGSDNDLVTEWVNDISEWSAGNIGDFTADVLSYTFSSAYRHEMLRKLEKNVPGEIRFRDFGTVDYLQNLGSDKTGTVELSASARTIEDSIQITERSRKFDGTHIHLTGAHEGEAQFTANLVPNDDPNTYENEVRYNAGSRWTEAADTDWDRWENKDVSDQETMYEEAESLIPDIQREHIEATTITNLDLTLGDWVQVVKPDADLDHEMRVHRITTKAGSRSQNDSSASVVYEVLLSTRTTVRDDQGRDFRDIQRFRTGFEGTSVWGTIGPVEQNVENGEPLQMRFFYPNIVYENVAELQVESLPYRAYTQGAASAGGFHSHGFDIDIPDHNHGFSINIPDHNHDVTIPVPNHQHDLGNVGQDASLGRTEDTFESSPTVENHSHIFQVASTLFDFQTEVSTSADGGGEFISTTTDDGGGVFQSETTDSQTPAHTHEPLPGVIEFGTETASGVDVVVNGSTVASNIGSGAFQETVDLSGELNTNAWNTVDIETDSIGRLIGSIGIDAYRQIGTGGN